MQQRLAISPKRLSQAVLWALVMMLGCGISVASPDTSLPLWAGKVPLATGSAATDTPAIDVYLPAKNPTQTGILVIPGGGYHYLAAPEGEPVAKWLCAHGIAAFVLHYRVAPYHYPAEMLDGQRAVRFIRSRAKDFGIDETRLGVWGFSAGGHMASYLLTHGQEKLPFETADAVDALDPRPNFGILAYPVISMKPGITHSGSHTSLLGDAPAPQVEDELSNELHVTDDSPPVFLFATSDDPVVPVENSVLFYQAYVHHHRPVEMHLFEHGSHGLVLAEHVPGASMWPDLLGAWMTRNGWMAHAEP
ncbi:beta-xylanase [Silvibacterium dinghuense]|nr:beta-xylanase [Silvibacterium dinghuense]